MLSPRDLGTIKRKNILENKTTKSDQLPMAIGGLTN